MPHRKKMALIFLCIHQLFEVEPIKGQIEILVEDSTCWMHSCSITAVGCQVPDGKQRRNAWNHQDFFPGNYRAFKEGKICIYIYIYTHILIYTHIYIYISRRSLVASNTVRFQFDSYLGNLGEDCPLKHACSDVFFFRLPSRIGSFFAYCSGAWDSPMDQSAWRLVD